MGTSPFSGGLMRNPAVRRVSPSKATCSPASIRRKVIAVSLTRVSGFSKAIPCQPSIMAWLEAPSPITIRPGASWERVVTEAASRAGVRV